MMVMRRRFQHKRPQQKKSHDVKFGLSETAAEGRLEKHKSGEVPLGDHLVKALEAKVAHCKAYQDLERGGPDKEKLLIEFRDFQKGNLRGTGSQSYLKKDAGIEGGFKGYGHKHITFDSVVIMFHIYIFHMLSNIGYVSHLLFFTSICFQTIHCFKVGCCKSV